MRGRLKGEERPFRNRDRHSYGEPYFKADWGNTGTLAHDTFKEEARAGSEKLKIAVDRLFARWEREHSFRAGAGKILLPAGYNPAVAKERAA